MPDEHAGLPFGLWLKERRKALDLTQDALAERAGCSAAMVRKLEAGSARPSRQLAELLAAALDLAPAERLAFVQRARIGTLPDSPPTSATPANGGAPRPPASGRPPTPAVAPPAIADADARPPAATEPVAEEFSALPLPPTPLVGREREVMAVRALLWRVGVRLLTLTGAPGIGKTRLALQVAAALQGEFADGVYFVALAPLVDPALVGAAIAGALGSGGELGPVVAGQPLLQTLRDYLRPRQVLLVLDNFEQVAAAAPLVADLLAHAAGLKVLVTSRAALRVRGEREYPVPPLALPAVGEALTPDDLATSEAVRLFLDRALDVAPDFQITPANAAAVAAICRRLDGLPLALELAAARVQILSPQALLARLGAMAGTPALDLLTGGARDLPPHQQTLRATIAWSYDLLAPAEQALFRRLAVFADGCTLDAAEQVAAGRTTDDGRRTTVDSGQKAQIAADSVPDTQHATRNTQHAALSPLDALAALVRQSLLRRETASDGTDRYRMLETIREYAGERLGAAGEAAAAQEAHAHYFLTLAETAAAQLRGPDAETWAARLDAELANLRAALEWSQADPDRAPIHRRLVAALAGFWRRQDHWREGQDQLARALACAPEPTAWRAGALAQAAQLACAAGDFTAGRAFAEEGLALSRQFANRDSGQQALNALAHVAANDGDYATSHRLLQESLGIQRELDDKAAIAESLLALGDMAFFQGDYAGAAGLYEESLSLTRTAGATRQLAFLLHRVAGAAVERGEYGRAAQILDESLALCRALAFRGGLASALSWSGELAAQQGHAAQAENQLREGLALMEELGDNQAIPWVLRSLGWLTARRGDLASGGALLEDSLARSRVVGNQWSICGALNGLGRLAVRQGDLPRAAGLLQESLGLARALGARQYLAKAFLGAAELAGASGGYTEAVRLLSAMRALTTRLDMHLGAGDQADFDAQIAAARAALPAPTFAAAWDAGQSLPLAEAGALAQSVLTPPSSI